MAIQFIGNIKIFRNAETANEVMRFDQIKTAVESLLTAHMQIVGNHPSQSDINSWNNKIEDSNITITPVDNQLVKITHDANGFVTGSEPGDLSELMNLDLTLDNIEGLYDELDKKVQDGSINLMDNIAISIDTTNHKIIMSFTDGITPSEKELELPIVSETSHGLISSEMMTKIESLKTTAESIESSVGRLPAHDFGTDTLTETLVNEYIATLGESVTVKAGTSIINLHNNHRWIYSDNPKGWQDQGLDDVVVATTDVPGTIRSLNETNGYLTVDPETGNCYVLGLDKIIASTKDGKVIMPTMNDDNSKKFIVSALKDDYETHLELSYSIAKDGTTKLDTSNILIYNLTSNNISEIEGELLAFDSLGRLMNTGIKASDFSVGDKVVFNTIAIDSSGSGWAVIVNDKDQFTSGRIDVKKMFPQIYRSGNGTKYVGLGVDAENIESSPEGNIVGNAIIGNTLNNLGTFKTYSPNCTDGSIIINRSKIKGYMSKAVENPEITG